MLFFFFLEIVLAIDRSAHIHAAKKIMIFAGYGTEDRVGSQVLKIGLDHRRAARQHLNQPMFALNEEAHDLVHRGRSSLHGGRGCWLAAGGGGATRGQAPGRLARSLRCFAPLRVLRVVPTTASPLLAVRLRSVKLTERRRLSICSAHSSFSRSL